MSREAFKEESIIKWKELINNLFDKKVPSSAIWNTEKDMTEILNLIAKVNNHMLLPSGGGLDLLSAKKGLEELTIELRTGDLTVDLVKPISLKFFKTIKDESCYFLLDTGTLKPTGIIDPMDLRFAREELAEYAPLKYSTRDIIDQGFLKIDQNGNEVPLPQYTRIVVRYFKGKFLLLTKGSPYNGSPDSYDGRHNSINENLLFNIIDSL